MRGRKSWQRVCSSILMLTASALFAWAMLLSARPVYGDAGKSEPRLATVTVGTRDEPGMELTLEEAVQTDAEQEEIAGAYPGLLLTPRTSAPVRDNKYRQTYRAVCYGYRARQTLDDAGKLRVTGWARRFAVHAPDRSRLPLAKSVTRLLLLIWNARHARRFPDHPGSAPVVDVWLTAAPGSGLSADIGGEQRGSDIWLYNIEQTRAEPEWAREVAHEYGHYALPGVSGFSAPEEWANGVLGERLFLAWLRDDLKAGRFAPAALPFFTPESLDGWAAKQIAPLVQRIARDGLDTRQFARRDASGMDYYTGLVLTVDALYGSAMLLDALSATLPGQDGAFVRPEDFLRGFQAATRDADSFALTPPFADAQTRTVTFWCYLPQGRWQVTGEGGLQAWKPAADRTGGKRATILRVEGSSGLRVGVSGWHRLQATRNAPDSAESKLAPAPTDGKKSTVNRTRLVFRKR